MVIDDQTRHKNLDFKEYLRQPARVKAAPMKLGEYNNLQGWEMPSDEDPDTDGYIIERQEGGHNSYTWMSKEEFEKSHTDEGMGAVSDGYHTFDELYRNRHFLFINVLKAHQENAFITRKNKEGEEWIGWFIAGINTSIGQISFHLPEEYWEVCARIAKVIDRNADYDGHNNKDVLGILLHMASCEETFNYVSEARRFCCVCRDIIEDKGEHHDVRRAAMEVLERTFNNAHL